MNIIATLLLLFILSGILLSPPADAASEGWRSVGFRAGFAADGLHQYEGFGDYRLPLEWRSEGGWGAEMLLDVSAGTLERQRDFGFMGSFGPVFAIGNPAVPCEMQLGVGTAIVNRDSLGNRDYNGVLQFLSFAGVHCRLTKNIGAIYRFQHISNAGMNGRRNPGVNLHIFGLSWEFDGPAALWR
jgi:hypothetical protein